MSRYQTAICWLLRRRKTEGCEHMKAIAPFDNICCWWRLEVTTIGLFGQGMVVMVEMLAHTIGGLSANFFAAHQSLASQAWRKLHELRMQQVADKRSAKKGFNIMNKKSSRIALQLGEWGISIGRTGDGKNMMTSGNYFSNWLVEHDDCQQWLDTRWPWQDWSQIQKTCLNCGKTIKLASVDG